MKSLVGKMTVITIAIFLGLAERLSIAEAIDIRLDATLRATENIIKKIERSRVYDVDADNIDKALDESVERIMKAYRESRGDKTKLIMLSEQLKRYQSKFKDHEERLKLMDSKIKNGDIMLSKKLLQRMNQIQIQQFKLDIAPQALRKYEKLHPMIFQPQPITPPGIHKSKPHSSIDNFPMNLGKMVCSFSDLLATPADAEVVTEAACFACQKSYEACKAVCPRGPWGCGPVCKACKYACYLTFLACLEPCARAEAKQKPKIDLVIKDLWVKPDANPGNEINEVNSGEKYYVCFIVENIGSAPSGSFVVQGGGLGIPYNPTQNHASLAPGQKREGCLEYPTTPPPKSYNLGISVDANNAVAESNERNNKSVETIVVLHPKKLEKEAEHVAEPVGLPDLVVTNIECIPDSLYGKLAFTIANQGNAPLHKGREIPSGRPIPPLPIPFKEGGPLKVEISVGTAPGGGFTESINLDLLSPIATRGGGIAKEGGNSTYKSAIDVRGLMRFIVNSITLYKMYVFR
ncbi:MAG: CARDB domain-containing protein [bacterium]